MNKCLSLSHFTFLVSNAKQAALNWCFQYGFQPFKYRGLETDQRDKCSHAIKLNDIVLVFVSPYHDGPSNGTINSQLVRHGNSIIDIAFNVKSLAQMSANFRARSMPIEEWTEEDENGLVRYGRVCPFGSTSHTLVERNNYPEEDFLPNWRANPLTNCLANSIWSRMPCTGLNRIDHFGLNQHVGTIKSITQWYSDTLQFKRFWTTDDTVVNTAHSGLRTIFMVNDDVERIKLAITEPIQGTAKSQIQEFLDYNRGPGVQHIAFSTADITESVAQLKDRGVQFLETPNAYYNNLEHRLKQSKIEIDKDISLLQKHNILFDYNESGHLYQIFTRPIQDRPTVLLELIERHHFGGFGEGNIKAFFEAIGEEQKLRKNE